MGEDSSEIGKAVHTTEILGYMEKVQWNSKNYKRNVGLSASFRSGNNLETISTALQAEAELKRFSGTHQRAEFSGKIMTLKYGLFRVRAKTCLSGAEFNGPIEVETLKW